MTLYRLAALLFTYLRIGLFNFFYLLSTLNRFVAKVYSPKIWKFELANI